MSIQPGVGYSFKQSSSGTVFDVDQPYTDPAPFVPPEQFEVLVSGNNVFTCKGRVITQDVWSGTGLDATTAEYDLTGIWAYPTGSKTTGSNASGPWADSEGFITIANAAAEGSDNWGVYIVRQPLNQASEFRSPALVIMADGSDAFDKTTPWGEADTTDSIRLYGYIGASALDVDGSPAGYLIGGTQTTPIQYNYNCQRVLVASIIWNGTTNVWDVTQELIGTITLPNIIQFYGLVLVVDGEPSPFTYWPQYDTESDAWNGAWSGYAKPTILTSVISPSGMPG
jgi:hypothetical protein